jgi:hypothetical protein
MTASVLESAPPMVVERVRLPDNPGPGRYNAKGEADPNGNVFVVFAGPTAHAWAVFTRNLLPNQFAAMIFENVAGSGLLDSIVSQWIKGGSGGIGENFNEPHIGEAMIQHIARQRAKGAVKVVGLNRSPAEVSAAAALLYIPGSGG